MYFIRKYADCWAIHNDNNGNSRKLSEEEKEKAKQEFPELDSSDVRTVFADEVKCIEDLP